MVDFQSRDTRRTHGGSDEDEEASDDDTDDTAPDSGATDTASEGETPGAGDAVSVPEGMTYALVTVGSAAAVDPADAAVPAFDGTEASVVARHSVEATVDAVQSAVGDLVERPDVAAVVTLGGVGLGPGDVTPDAVEALFDKRMDGFGELYRVLAHEREGTAVVRARVTAGLVGTAPVFCLPGDPEAARYGLEQLVLAEAEAVVDEAATGSESADGV
jgi:molybdenum cofactor biosynthesis protein B